MATYSLWMGHTNVGLFTFSNDQTICCQKESLTLSKKFDVYLNTLNSLNILMVGAQNDGSCDPLDLTVIYPYFVLDGIHIEI